MYAVSSSEWVVTAASTRSGAVPPTQSVTLRLRPYREEEIGDRSCFELSIEER